MEHDRIIKIAPSQWLVPRSAGPIRGDQGVRCFGARFYGRGPRGKPELCKNEERVKGHKQIIKKKERFILK